MAPQKSEEVICRIATMTRTQLIEYLTTLNTKFTLDFTQDYLDSMSLERLRHVVLAASLHDQSHHAA